VLERDNIDTDQIIPARFLTTTTSRGLGAHLFADWRFTADDRPQPDCPLNDPGVKDCAILVAGANFACGSSREHAPWALLDFGFRAVISSKIADIFAANALQNGLVPVVVDIDCHRWLLDHAGAEVTVDIEHTCLQFGDKQRAEFPLDPFARHCLLQGIDTLGYLLQHEAAIAAFEKDHES